MLWSSKSIVLGWGFLSSYCKQDFNEVLLLVFLRRSLKTKEQHERMPTSILV